MTHTYIFDWNGTLDQLVNPKGFIRALQSKGHKVVIWTGQMEKDNPAFAAADAVRSKFSTLREVVTEFRQGWGTNHAFVSDDDDWVAESVESLKTVIEAGPVSFIDPRDLKSHLSSLA